ncbi:MAG: hypothetical protein Q7S22_02560 [Candidatus Micrarchaeota archaeon]|nr:hypothetical protein [Candidatus Micrarchaeota archaeon]
MPKRLIVDAFTTNERLAGIEDILMKKADECAAFVPARSSLATIDRDSLERIAINFGSGLLSGIENIVSNAAGEISSSISDGFDLTNATLEDGFDDVVNGLSDIEASVDMLNDTVKYGLEKVRDQLEKNGYTLEEIKIVLEVVNTTLEKGLKRIAKGVERSAVANEATAVNTVALVGLQRNANYSLADISANTGDIADSANSIDSGIWNAVDRLSVMSETQDDIAGSLVRANDTLDNIDGGTYAISRNTGAMADSLENLVENSGRTANAADEIVGNTSDIALSGRQITDSIQRMGQSLRDANAVNIVGQLEGMLTAKNYDGYTSILETFVLKRTSISYDKLSVIAANKHTNIYLRLYAITKLSEMGRGASILVKILSDQSEKERTRKFAEVLIKKMGINSVSGLSVCLKDSNLVTRRNAALFLLKLVKKGVNIEKVGSLFARAIVTDLNDNITCSYAIAAMLTALKNGQRIRGIYGLASAFFWSENEEVKKLANAALDIVGIDKVISVLAGNVKNSKDESVKRFSAYCIFNFYMRGNEVDKKLILGKIIKCGTTILPYLADILKDKELANQNSILEILSKMNKKGISLEYVFDSIIAATGDEKEEIIAAAIALLEQIGSTVLGNLKKTLISNSSLALNAAVMMVRISKDAENAPYAVTYIVNTISDANLERRKCAISAIALAVNKGFEPDVATLPLITALGDQDEQVRTLATDTLVKIGIRAVSVLDAVLKSSDANTRQNATIILNRIAITGKDISGAVGSLVQVITDSNPVTKQQGISALAVAADKGVDLSTATIPLITTLASCNDEVSGEQIARILIKINPVFYRNGMSIRVYPSDNYVTGQHSDSPIFCVFKDILLGQNILARRIVTKMVGELTYGHVADLLLLSLVVSDKDAQVRNNSRDSLIKMGDKTKSLLEYVSKGNGNSLEMVATAKNILGQMGKDLLLDDKTLKPPKGRTNVTGVERKPLVQKMSV